MNIHQINWEVLQEVDAALEKFPTWPTDPLHALAVLGEEVGELNKAVLQTVYEPHKSPSGVVAVKREAVQVAAMALRFLASIEAYEFSECKQHGQYGRFFGVKGVGNEPE
jgi:hypothetical protein